MREAAALLGVAAVLVWRPPWSWIRVRVHPVTWPRPGRRELVPAAVLASGASLTVLPAAPTILAWTAAGVAVAAAVRWQRARRRRRRLVVRDECQVVIDGLVGELRSGVPPTTALQRLELEAPVLRAAATAAATGGDVATALLELGRRPGAEALRGVGQAWAVSQSCGVALVDTLERVREAAREDRELERELAAGVAPARATALLVIAMPPLGLGLGTGLGVDPLDVVLTTVPGAACVALGVAFAVAGVLWIEGIADRLEAGG
ncbi:type II secretion system F family protein [Aeromicrobium tamlense]|uniref:Tight adherence protein B n=1 Tax=Aeromicrobium tamlense TaxID=375541 RepID=A0A8I0FT48_9ACTN|nr:type II secretion system F family protein [Aeromicrobium tamlense]MBD1269579.1 type II secretion system F family protein [Aeromicrobium tamlense]NYI39766.1 tight adherence protein B [Aeromicrobium tamlense]